MNGNIITRNYARIHLTNEDTGVSLTLTMPVQDAVRMIELAADNITAVIVTATMDEVAEYVGAGRLF